jgi:hypothetical protein
VREVYLATDGDSPLDDGPWLVQPLVESVHVVREVEAARHELDRGCWCAPELELVDPETGEQLARELVIHRSDALRAATG